MICSTKLSVRECCPTLFLLTSASHYYEGLLAAVRPHEQGSPVPPSSVPPPPTETSPPPPAENHSWEELVKRRLHPLDAFVRLLDCAAANRPPDAEDQFRFRWFGLFYQAPERDAFTLRLRLPGGRLKPWQLTGLADLTQRHAGGHVLCNAQGGLDVPGVPIASAIDAMVQAESIGFSSLRTGGDCVQAIRGGELDGLPDHSGEQVPFYPLVCALEQACSLSPALADLPLPCEILFAREDQNTETQPQSTVDTIVLRLFTNASGNSTHRYAPSPEPSFILYLPGDTDGFCVAPPCVIPACLGLLKGWAAGADRSSRDAASLRKFAAGVDLDALEALPGEARREPLPLGSKPRASPDHTATLKGYPAPGGRLLSGQLAALDQCCEPHGWSEIRVLCGQLYAVGVRGEVVDAADGLRAALSD